MTLQQLAALLKQQASSSPNRYIQLSDQTLQQTGISQLIKTNLLRQDGTLFLVVDPNTIPVNPPQTGFSLSGQTPSVPLDTFLNLDARDISINFVSIGNQIEFTLTISLTQSNQQPVSWVMSDSYPELAGLPFDNLNLPAPQMILVTATGGTPPQGLNFQSTFALNNLFQQITDLLKGSQAQLTDGRSFAELQQSGTAPYVLAGALTQSDQGVSFDLRADLGVSPINIGTLFQITDLFAGVSQQWVTNSDGTPQSLLMLYLGTDVVIGNTTPPVLPLELIAQLPINGQASVMTLMILPVNPLDTSLGSLGNLIGGESWSNFFSGSASSIGQLLDTFGFKSFVTTFSLSNFSVISFSLNVGTLQDWPLFSPLKSMSLDIDWLVMFTSGNTLQTVTIEAIFNLTDTLSFDVEIILPDLLITGTEHGPPTTLTLSQISQEIFGSSFNIPDELLTFSFGDLSVGIDVTNKVYSFGAVAGLSFNLFGTQILSLENMALQVVVNTSGAQTTYTVTLNGFVSLGPITFSANATISNTQDTIFVMHLVNETVGSMLNHLVHLVDPTFDISLPAPWDRFLNISLDAFVLSINVTKKSVSLSYPTTLDLGFIQFTNIALTYTKSDTAASSVQIEISGSFLGQEFGKGGNAPLAWDAINQQPPAVPGSGSSYLDIQYLGIGQHITFTNLDKLTNMQAVMTGLRNSVIPLPGNTLPAFGKNGLSFSKDSNWLIGAQFTLIDTVSLSIIFNDPNLYGLMISLAGSRAKSFAGLSFQILYRKITNDIGVYHIELKLPDAFRTLQFGEVTITLPVIVVDIYTNGNFRIDFGFPKGLDFSNSFSLQVLPFVGFGGFYFALLNGQTSTRVPKITNGNFNPVIEFGIALSIGVGKTVNAGVLSGGITVTVIGILEGVIAWFNPNSSAVSKEEYYWIQGTIAIVGKLYATIDFVIIKASLDVTAYASVTLTIEAHQPIYIAISAGVSVRVSVKIVFFTIHLSFQATISASFTIGSATPTPWQLASGSSSSANNSAAPRQLAVAASSVAAAPALLQLRGQDTLHSPQQIRYAGLTTVLRQQRMMALAAVQPAMTWTPVAVFDGQIQPLDVDILIGFTKSETASGTADAVLLFCLENSINPRAITLTDHQQLFGDDPQSAEFNLLLQGMLKWAIITRRNSLGEPTDIVTADDLAYLKCQLQQSAVTQAAFNYPNLSAFFALNYQFTLQPPIDATSDTGVTLFPVFPALTLTTNDSNNVDIPFDNWPQPNQADPVYQEKIDLYFQWLQVQFDRGTASQTANSCSNGDTALASPPGSVSMATVLFEQYFSMLASSAVQAAIDEMATFSYTNPAATPFGIQDIISGANGIHDSSLTPLQIVTPNQGTSGILNTAATLTFNSDPTQIVVKYQVRLGDSFTSIADSFAKQGAFDGQGQTLSAAELLTANLDNPAFIPDTQVAFNGITYTTQEGDTLNLIAARLLVRVGPVTRLAQIANLAQFANDIIAANPGITPDDQGFLKPGTLLSIPSEDADDITSPPLFVDYTTVEGDTFTLVAAYFSALVQGAVSFPGYVELILQDNTLPVTDPTALQPVGTPINLPLLTRALQTGDTANSLAVTLIAAPSAIQTSLLAVPSTTNLLAPQVVLALPVLTYPIQSADTLNSIAQKFNLSLDQLASEISTTPQLFLGNATVIVNQVETVGVELLLTTLLGQGEWNNLAGMTSRFLLNGLRLPDPNSPTFEDLTVEELQNPAVLAGIATQPMYWLTGQQFPIQNPPPADYTITLTDSESASWLVLQSSPPSDQLQFGLFADQLTMLNEIATTPFDPQILSLSRLELFQLAPPRFSLQQHLTWQAATLPAASCISAAAQATGNPSIWLFPDALITTLTNNSANQLQYEVVVGTHENASTPMTISDVNCYNWATMLQFTISQPPAQSDGSNSTANAYIIGGTDDDGRSLLQSVYERLTNDNDQATLYLLYSPNPTSANPSGLNSDSLDPNQTFLLKTNLSTLSHSGPTALQLSVQLAAAPPATPVFSAPLADASDFIKLLWEASVVNSGGFYLNYDNTNGNVGLPAQLFAQSSTATLYLFVLLNSQLTPQSPIYSFNNCAVIGDNLDTSQANVFVQPVIYVVQSGDTLTKVANWYTTEYRANLQAADVASLNADVPLLLQIGATIQVPVSGQVQNHTIVYGDTLASIAKEFDTDVKTLAATGNNAQAAILAIGAQMQFAPDILSPTASVPPGNIGFEMSQTNPDPDNLPYNQLTAQQMVNSLFHLFGYSIAATPPTETAPGFIASGVGLPTGPANSDQDDSDGVNQQSLDDVPLTDWNYRQTLAIAPFATSAQGSLSAALPAASANPYAGVAANNSVTLNFVFQDIYGNQQAAPEGYDSLPIPVGYYDQIIGISQWPGVSSGYLVTGGATTQIEIDLSLQIDKYVPSPSLSVAAAWNAANGDATTYTQVYYQIQQSDLQFALETSLDQRSINSMPPRYPITPDTPFSSFVNAAYVFLSALQTLAQFQYATANGDTVSQVTDDFGVTGAQLFNANAGQAYSALFGSASLAVPVLYPTQQNDTLNSISAIPAYQPYNLSPSVLATNNPTVALNPGVDLSAPNRPYVTHDKYTLEQIAEEWRCTVAGIALANHDVQNILQTGNTITIEGKSYVTGSSGQLDTFDSLVAIFANQFNIALTVEELAAAIAQTVPGIFIDGVTLTITDIVVQQGDNGPQPSYTVQDDLSLQAIAQQLNRSVIGLAITNHNIPGLFQPNVSFTAFGKSVSASATDSFDSIAAALTTAAGQPVTIANVAVMNQSANIFAQNVVLQTTQTGDSFGSLQAVYSANGFTIDGLAVSNADVPNLFAPSTAIFIGTDAVAPVAGDTLSDFASRNRVTPDQLGAYNPTANFVVGATLAIPYLVTNTNTTTPQYAVYSAQSSDRLEDIAGKYATGSPTLLATLNQDLTGLFAIGQKIIDNASGKFVITESSDTFNSILAGFSEQGVTLTLDQLATAIAAQTDLLQTGGVWITPPMQAANTQGGQVNTLAGLAAKYNLDASQLATVNASVQGFLASGVTLTFEGQTLVTKANDTLTSLVNRFAQLGLTTDVGTLATAFQNVNGLLTPTARVVPLPVATTAQVAIEADFSAPIFELIVDVVMRRGSDFIDPDFKDVASVSAASTALAPQPDPNGNSANGAGLSLTDFATAFQEALPGLFVATGSAIGEFDSSSSRRLWVVNLGNSIGQQMTYQFGNGSQMQFFAIPPISTSLIAGTAPIQTYTSGQGLSGTTQPTNYQSVDLDVWAATFLQAIDLFLSPAYAVPAYQLDPAHAAYDNVLAQKQTLADAISQKVEYILNNAGSPPDATTLADAQATMLQALLVELGSAYSINSLVQAPVVVTSQFNTEDVAPRLSGKPVISLRVTGATSATPIVITSPNHNLPNAAAVAIADVQGNTAANGTWTITVIDQNRFSLDTSSGSGSPPYVEGTGTVTIAMSGLNDYSLSTAKVPLVNGTMNATFLLTVKSPADNARANLALRYVINEIEVPESNAMTIDGYQPSNWLTFILPVDTAASTIGGTEIPIPLRSYPSPVTLNEQSSQQTPNQLAGWDYSFTYQHLDADQDTTEIQLQFNSSAPSAQMQTGNSALFQALAQFIAVYPQLKNDLALLPLITPGQSNNTALVAINVLSQLVQMVATAWGQGNAAKFGTTATPQIFNYTLQPERNDGQFTTLTLTVDGQNPTDSWPTIAVNVNGTFESLTLQSSTATSALYDYPQGVMAGLNLEQQFLFSGLNIFDKQDGWAGVSITRNADLIPGVPTNQNFIYQTPITGFSAVEIPFIHDDTPIDINSSPPIALATALGHFFEDLLTGDTATSRTIRVACNYGYQLAGASAATTSNAPLPTLKASQEALPLVAFMPILLIPSYDFQLPADWNSAEPTSFVYQLAQAVVCWNEENNPSTTNGAVFFDISIFSTLSEAVQMPLIELTEVRYVLPLVGEVCEKPKAG